MGADVKEYWISKSYADDNIQKIKKETKFCRNSILKNGINKT